MRLDLRRQLYFQLKRGLLYLDTSHILVSSNGARLVSHSTIDYM